MRQVCYAEKDFNNFIYKNIGEVKFPARIIIEPFKKPKTKDQLGFIFGGLFEDLLNFYNENGELFNQSKVEKWDIELVKIKLYNECLGLKYKMLPNGEVVPYQKTMSKMDIDEMSDFICKSRDYMLSIGCKLRPEIEFSWLLKTKDEEIERAMILKVPETSPLFLKFLCQEFKCFTGCGKDAEVAHHLRLPNMAGTSTKPPDWCALPLCDECHKLIHNREKELYPMYGYDLKIVAKLNYVRWYLHK